MFVNVTHCCFGAEEGRTLLQHVHLDAFLYAPCSVASSFNKSLSLTRTVQSNRLGIFCGSALIKARPVSGSHLSCLIYHLSCLIYQQAV